MTRGRPKKAATVQPEVEVQPVVTKPVQSVAISDELPTASDKQQRIPATFEKRGRLLVCTVCGTRASADIDKNLFCSNEHNHPFLEEVSNVE